MVGCLIGREVSKVELGGEVVKKVGNGINTVVELEVGVKGFKVKCITSSWEELDRVVEMREMAASVEVATVKFGSLSLFFVEFSKDVIKNDRGGGSDGIEANEGVGNNIFLVFFYYKVVGFAFWICHKMSAPVHQHSDL
eukprot:Phypoly_transcript_05989.p2 GENE.Phypoly_transcript_05989~~Phypoly_transcript_05989.p2  ORF type:complete len:139 (+),score=12.84 Phypoly_transcript_05989:1266-1682(+)